MKKTIRDYDLKGKKVIIRCDFNVPIKDGVITDDNRIKESLETINYAISHKDAVHNIKDIVNNTVITLYGDRWCSDLTWRSFHNACSSPSAVCAASTKIIHHFFYFVS